MAGWAILLDYLIVLAIWSFAISHYLAAFWHLADQRAIQLVIAARGARVRGHVEHPRHLGGPLPARASPRAAQPHPRFRDRGCRRCAVLGLHAITDSIHLGSAPNWNELIFGLVVATVALTGIEAASGLAGEIRLDKPALSGWWCSARSIVLVVFVAISIIALMARPVTGPTRRSGDQCVDAPVLGVVSAFEPAWLTTRSAGSGASLRSRCSGAQHQMLGLSRLSYSLATNRQIPSAVGNFTATLDAVRRDHRSPRSSPSALVP